MAIGDKAGLAEELRLLYVALTRAKDELAVHVPLRYHVNRHGHDDRHLYAQMSRFIEPVRGLFDERSVPAIDDTIAFDQIEGDSVVDDVDSMLADLWQ
jgi:ATP-dependent exoDNAse (exonuclease V) beta subunit